MTKADRLLTLASRLNDDEIDVLIELAEGLGGKGRKEYGPLDLDTDPRDFVVEALEENRDQLVYASAALVKVRRALERTRGKPHHHAPIAQPEEPPPLAQSFLQGMKVNADQENKNHLSAGRSVHGLRNGHLVTIKATR